MSFWNADTFGDDQYSEYTVAQGPGSAYQGVVVRAASGPDGYFWIANLSSPNGSLYRVDDGTFTELQGGIPGPTAVNDVLRLEAEGSNLRCYLNGVQTGSTQSDATYASGSAGVGVSFTSGGSPARGDDWEGGNLGGASPTATRGLFSYTVLDTPNVATRGRLSFAELEVPLVATRGRLSFGEFEVPLAGTRGRLGFSELEVPAVAGPDPTAGRVSFAELETPFGATRGLLSYSEFEVPLVGTRGRFSFIELETPLGATRGQLSFLEIEVPAVPSAGLVSWIELRVPDVGEVTVTRRLIMGQRVPLVTRRV